MSEDHDENCECIVCEKGWEDFWKAVETNIAEYGETIIGTPDFSYTVGLSDKSLPEVICFGLPIQIAHALLNDIADQLKAGKIKPDEPIEGIANGYTLYRRAASACMAR